MPTLTKKRAATRIGVLMGFDAARNPLVDYPGAETPRPARSTVALGKKEIGAEVVLIFAERTPVVLGVLKAPGETRPIDIEMDGETVTFTAEKEIVLRCGKSSLTLTRAGKVLIRGAYLLSRSSGINRIKGGAVQIN